MAQEQLAGLLELDQSYLSGLETGRKGAPPASMILRMKEALSLNEAESAALQQAVDLSRRKIEIPMCADPAEYALMHSLVRRLGHLRPAQVRAMQEILSI